VAVGGVTLVQRPTDEPRRSCDEDAHPLRTLPGCLARLGEAPAATQCAAVLRRRPEHEVQ
jgi:hypothetical protein